MAIQDIEAYVEELTRRAAKRKPAEVERPSPPGQTPGEAALEFVERAGARLVAACPVCHPSAPAGAAFIVLVPKVNDTPEFRAAMEILRVRYLVVPRTDPLAHLPARCQHVQEGPR